MFNRSEVIALTNKQTDRQTDKQTDAAENITSLRYATPVGKNSFPLTMCRATWTIRVPVIHGYLYCRCMLGWTGKSSSFRSAQAPSIWECTQRPTCTTSGTS